MSRTFVLSKRARGSVDTQAPVRGYFPWVGGALLVLLFAANSLLPAPLPSKLIESHSALPPIRITSELKGPEAVVIDTSQPGFLPILPDREIAAPSPLSSDVADAIRQPASMSERADASDGSPAIPHEVSRAYLGTTAQFRSDSLREAAATCSASEFRYHSRTMRFTEPRPRFVSIGRHGPSHTPIRPPDSFHGQPLDYLMSKKRLLAIMVMSATLAATGGIADVTHTPLDATNRGVAAQGDADEAVIRRLLEQFRTIRISLSQAVAIAEHLHDGSRAADVSFEISGPVIYRVRTVGNERIWENVIDANTGSVTEKEISSALRELDREDFGNIIALKSVEQELSDAVRIAEKAAAGSALAGGLMKQDGKLNFVVVIANGDRLKEVVLEPPRVGRQGTNRH